jgi:hypothetical protein
MVRFDAALNFIFGKILFKLTTPAEKKVLLQTKLNQNFTRKFLELSWGT